VERLVLHTLDEAGSGAVTTARRLVGEQIARGETIETRELIRRLTALGFEWGESDGN
jgi:hypothetical protein